MHTLCIRNAYAAHTPLFIQLTLTYGTHTEGLPHKHYLYGMHTLIDTSSIRWIRPHTVLVRYSYASQPELALKFCVVLLMRFTSTSSLLKNRGGHPIWSSRRFRTSLKSSHHFKGPKKSSRYFRGPKRPLDCLEHPIISPRLFRYLKIPPRIFTGSKEVASTLWGS